MGGDLVPKIMAALVRGFFIFLFFIAGQLIITGAISTPGGAQSTSPDDYTRLAGICSLLAFSVGFKPQIFHDFLIKVTGGISGVKEAGN